MVRTEVWDGPRKKKKVEQKQLCIKKNKNWWDSMLLLIFNTPRLGYPAPNEGTPKGWKKKKKKLLLGGGIGTCAEENKIG